MKLGFFVDKNKCSGCKACVITCKDKCKVEVGNNFRKVQEKEEGQFPNVKLTYSTMSCNNCEKAPCIENCPTGAMNRENKFKVVLVNKQKCIGCGVCAKVCPYNAPFIDQKTHKSRKCDFCVDLLEENQLPACVTVCNTRALDFGDVKHLLSKDKKCKMEESKVEANLVIIDKR